jgi:hypothetical protein
VLLLLIVGGAIINIAVAWGLTMWGPFAGASSIRSQVPDADEWLGQVPEDWPAAPNRASSNVMFGRSQLRRHAVLGRESVPEGEPFFFIQTANRSGLPMHALECGHRARIFGFGKSDSEHFNDAGEVPLQLVRKEYRGRRLPLRPLWPGFAINTLFYGGILWLLFAAPFALRRRRRMKRGLCPKCAYPVGLSDVCTECGKPVRPKEMMS